MQKVKLGIVGCGVIGRRHLELCGKSEAIDVVAIADRIDEKLRKASEDFGVKTTYREGSDLLAQADVDAVILATPTGDRSDLSIQALENGKHVLLEKPGAMNAEEVRAMMAIQGDRTVACCSSRYRFTQGAVEAEQFLATGALGPLRMVRVRATSPAGAKPESFPPDWRLVKSRNGGGFLVNWGVYDMDYLLGITGWSLQPRTVFAQAWPMPKHLAHYVVPETDAETYYSALIRCDGGTVISMERGEYMPTPADSDWQIIGEKGALTLRMTHHGDSPRTMVHDDTTSDRGLCRRTVWEIKEGPVGPGVGVQEDFALAILEGRPPKTSLEQWMVIQKIIDAIYASAETGTAVEIE